MSKSRLEAFTDGVIAIIITILVLDFDVPETGSWQALFAMKYHFFIYFISFITIAIYWINHHHMLQVTDTISTSALWLNIIFLLCISLLPFSTSWVSRFPDTGCPELLYASLMLIVDIVWYFLAKALVKENGEESNIAKALEGSKKSHVTMLVIIIGMICGVFKPFFAIIGCLLSLLPWLVPDKKIEKILRSLPKD